jgi:hypothetical protein
VDGAPLARIIDVDASCVGCSHVSGLLCGAHDRWP